MTARHRRLSPFRTTIRTGSLLAVAAATGLGMVLAGGASQAVTVGPASLAASSHAATWRHSQHLAHLAHLAARVTRPVRLTAYHGSAGGSSFQACVIARESGGQPQVMNASGHYGLYQFSEQTWVAYGGSPSTFGHASVAEQNRVFGNAIAAGGRSNWAPYDGC